MLICIPLSSRSPQGYLSSESKFQQLKISKGLLLASKAFIILLKDIFEVWALETSHSVPQNNISHISRITPPPPLLSVSLVLTQSQHQKIPRNPTWFKLGLWLDRFKTMTQGDFDFCIGPAQRDPAGSMGGALGYGVIYSRLPGMAMILKSKSGFPNRKHPKCQCFAKSRFTHVYKKRHSSLHTKRQTRNFQTAESNRSTYIMRCTQTTYRVSMLFIIALAIAYFITENHFAHVSRHYLAVYM